MGFSSVLLPLLLHRHEQELSAGRRGHLPSHRHPLLRSLSSPRDLPDLRLLRRPPGYSWSSMGQEHLKLSVRPFDLHLHHRKGTDKAFLGIMEPKVRKQHRPVYEVSGPSSILYLYRTNGLSDPLPHRLPHAGQSDQRPLRLRDLLQRRLLYIHESFAVLEQSSGNEH